MQPGPLNNDAPLDGPPNKLGLWIDWLRQQRSALIGIAVAPVALALVLGLVVLPKRPTWEFPCPLYPNGTIAMTASFYESCPLEFPDFVSGLAEGKQHTTLRGEEEVRAPLRAGHPVRYVIQPTTGSDFEITLAPVLVAPGEAAARLASAALLAWILTAALLLTTVRARLPASLPFSLLHAAAGVGIVATVAGWTSSAFEVPAAIARATTGAALAHLALVFPHRRGIVELAPELIAVPYFGLFLVCAVEVDAAYRGSAISTALAQRLLMTGVGISGIALSISCLMTARESRSHLARGQARVFLGGALCLVLPVALVWVFGSPSARLTAITLFAALMPFPAGYAISRYQLYDLDSSIRRSIAHALYLSLWSGAFFLTVRAFGPRLDLPEPLHHPTVTFAAVYGVLLPVDAARSVLRRRVARLLVSQRVDWDRLGLEYSQRIAAQRDVESVARVTCEAIRAGISNAGVALLVRRGDDFAWMHGFGVRAFSDARIVSRLLHENPQPVIDVNRLDATEDVVADAYAAGIEAIARIESGDNLLGCIAIFPERRGRLLAASEQLWIATIAGHTATALLALRFEQDLRVSERFAARGRTETEIAHEIGKPLGVLERTAQTLADAIDPDDPLAPQLTKIARLAEHVRDVAREVLVVDGAHARTKLASIVQRACGELRTIHGDGRVVLHPVPELGELPSRYDRLVRVLVNLLDNAIRASAPDSAVELRLAAHDDRLVLCVEDRGIGMSDDELARAFDPFTSFRPDGNGLGLSISRQAATSLRGTLRLERREGGGMRALLEVPLPAPENTRPEAPELSS
jgi:signal transduction histidine kinase